jgi:type IV secretory pathway VirB10-like protein
MSTSDQANATVVDRRPAPRGVLPKGIQTWLMVGIAGVIVIIILFAGQSQAPQRTVQAATPSAAANPDRVRDYQQRLNAINAQLAMPTSAAPAMLNSPEPAFVGSEPPEHVARQVDPTAAERQRRDYESLFASNVVVSRRAPLQRSDSTPSLNKSSDSYGGAAAKEPSLDDVADAVVRATTRVAPSGAVNASPVASPDHVATTAPRADVAAGPLYRIAEGTIIDAVLTNRLDGGSSSPVNCLVTNSIYSHDGRLVLIPAGARVLGETHAVEGLGETRLAVSFHRIVMPDGSSSISLDHFSGLNQLGDAGLRDQVNRHYWSTFGSAAAVGLVGGLSQLLGNVALGSGDGDRTVIVAGGSADAASQAAAQTMSQYLNRMPTITIREGHRIKVYVTRDVDVPEWNGVAASGGEE